MNAGQRGPGSTGDTALYRYRDTAGRLLYIGITYSLGGRERGHSRSSIWMQLVASSTVERRPEREDALAAEREAIETEHPLFNRQYNDTPEARARLKSYLEEIGRMDLYVPWNRVQNRPPGELETLRARKKREAKSRTRQAAPGLTLEEIHAEIGTPDEPLHRYGFSMLGGLAKWYGDRPITQEDAEGMIAALRQEFPDLDTEHPPSPVAEAAPEFDEYEVAVQSAGVVILTVRGVGGGVAEVYLGAIDAHSISDALGRHARDVATNRYSSATTFSWREPRAGTGAA
jgi:hypothetical protein